MSTFGSTNADSLKPEDPAIKQARETAIKTATVQGVSVELQKQKQHLNTLNDKIDSVMNLVMTLQNQMNQFQQQRAIELSKMVNHGPTSIS